MAGLELSVLAVDTRGAAADAFVEFADERTDIDVTPVTSLPAAHDLLATDHFDCLVVHTEPPDDDGRQFVADARSVAPGCPVILLTQRGTDTLPDAVVSQATSIVERPDEQNNWGFLVGKIQSSLRTNASRRHDAELYRRLVENTRDGLYRLDANGDIVYLNDSFADMLGYSREELLGVHGSEAMADGELERGQRIIQQLVEDDDRESDIMDMELIRSDGDRIVASVHFVVLTTEDGAYDGVMGVVRDVTERQERKRQLERQNQRLEEFASVVSHDLRNPLNVAEGRLDLARETGDVHHLDEVADAHARMRELIDDLLALAQSGERVSDLEVVDLAAVVDQCWQNVAAPNATLENETSLAIRADRSRLKQLLENLMRNAVEHGGEAVRVVVGDLDGEDGFYVADDGPGISSQDREKVFDAGYSTDTDGTGFGLSIVEDLVDAHGWEATVTDGGRAGARFEITGVDTSS